MARRFGSAMISNTDSTLFVYSTEHMLVKVYKGRGDSGFSRRAGLQCPDQCERPKSEGSAILAILEILKKAHDAESAGQDVAASYMSSLRISKRAREIDTGIKVKQGERVWP